MTLIGYTGQKVATAWIALAHAATMRPSSEMVAQHLLFNDTWNFSEVYPRRVTGLGSKGRASIIYEALGPNREKKETADEVWERSAVVDEALC